MANPFKHSISAVKIIKNDLSRIKKIINYAVNIVFVSYCLYLIFSNLDSIPYIVIYSLILAITIATFFIEPKLKSKEDDERKTKRLKKKQRIFVMLILRSLKYVCKAIAIVIAVYEIATSASVSDLSIIATIVSGIILLLQIIYDFVVLLVERYLDILQIAIEEDIRSSKTLQFVIRFANKDYVDLLKEDKKTYTENELKILETLENFENGKEKVKAIPVSKEIQRAYDSCKDEAAKVLQNKKKEKALFKKVQSLELPKDINEFQEVPSLVSFVKSYKKKKYDFISEEKATSALASLIYLTKKNDLIPDSNKNFGYMDDQVILKKSLNEIDAEYTQFLDYKENKPSLFKKKN